MAFTPKRKEDIEFIYHLSQRLRLSKYIQVGALPSYNANDILNICTFYPTSVIERKKIVNILNTIEERIDKQTEIITALKKYTRPQRRGDHIHGDRRSPAYRCRLGICARL